MIRANSRGVPAEALAAHYVDRQDRAALNARAWEPYVWPVSGVDDLRVAPFHLLASEGRVWFDQDHLWHMGLADRLAVEGQAVVAPTRWRLLDLSDAGACTEAPTWWETLTTTGGEVMVVKPRDFIARAVQRACCNRR